MRIDRFWWIEYKAGQCHKDRVSGTVTGHWKATGGVIAVIVQCDDGREYKGEPIPLNLTILDEPRIGQKDLF